MNKLLVFTQTLENMSLFRFSHKKTGKFKLCILAFKSTRKVKCLTEDPRRLFFTPVQLSPTNQFTSDSLLIQKKYEVM